MQCRLMAVLILALSITIYSPIISEARKDTRVKGHVKKGGKYVTPHNRTSPNKNKLDNYGTKGNMNPNTGKVGKDDPFMPPKPKGR